MTGSLGFGCRVFRLPAVFPTHIPGTPHKSKEERVAAPIAILCTVLAGVLSACGESNERARVKAPQTPRPGRAKASKSSAASGASLDVSNLR